jgi:hypothetical protein
MGVFQNNLMGAAAAAASAGGGDFYSHQIANSCRLDGTGYLTDTRSSDGSTNHATVSIWFKRSKLGSYQYLLETRVDGNNYVRLTIQADDTIEFQGEVGAAMIFELETTQVFRDTSAWYHFVGVIDFDNSTQADRAQMYINGERITDFDVETYPSDASKTMVLNTSDAFRLGASGYDGSYDWNGYLAEVVVIDGTAQAVTDLGETKNGVWIPKDPSGLTFGTNGFYLKFESSSDLGNDSSGNNHDFALTNILAHDQMLDSPTFDSSSNGGNFMTYNGAMLGANNTLSEGNLKSSGTGGGNTEGTFGMLTGKWYWECRVEDLTDYGPTFGIGQYGAGGSEGVYNIITWQSQAGQMYGGGGYPDQMGTISVTSTGVTSLADADIMSFWLDCDNGKLWIGKNGTIPNSGDPANGTNPQASWSTIPTNRYFMATCQNVSSGIGVLNAGQNPSFNGALTGSDVGDNADKNGYGLFKYDPSSTDFIACCAANIPTADAIDPSETDDDYPQKLFSPLLYTGNGGTNNITGLGFQPDFTWIKIRNTASNGPLVDSSRGTNKILFSQITDAEVTSANLTSFDSDGFSLAGGLASYDPNFNGNTNTYASWNWRANGGTTSSNSDGTITTTLQVNSATGFSIGTYSGSGSNATLGHGLGARPDMSMFRERGTAGNWIVTFQPCMASNDHNLYLQTHIAESDGNYFQNTAMTTSVISIGTHADINGSGASYVMWNFINVEGFSKFGSYRGNGLSDAQGTFVYTGFRPAYVMTKGLDVGAEWTVYDDKRNTGNPADRILQMDIHDAERTDLDVIDILSNGFKCLDTGGRTNQSNKSYVYAAFADNPFQYATAR